MEFSCDHHLCVDPFVVGTIAFRNFGKVAGALRRNHINFLRHLAGDGKRRFEVAACFFHDVIHHDLVQGIHAGVVELRCDGAINRHVVYWAIPQVVVALVLLANVTQGI